MNKHLLSRRDWVKLSAAFCVAGGAMAHPDETAARLPALGQPLGPLGRKLLGASDSQLAKLELGRKRRLIEVAAVHLPQDPPGDCNHYGWPIATMVGQTIIVMHRRIPGHNPRGAGKPHEKMSYGIVLSSSDGGKTWSQPYDLRDGMRPEDRLRGGIVPLSHRFKFDKGNTSTKGYKIHLHAIGTTRDDHVVAINNHGVFRSKDQGQSWEHFPQALREDTFPHPNAAPVFRGSLPDGGAVHQGHHLQQGLWAHIQPPVAGRAALKFIPLLFCGKTTLEDLRTLDQAADEGIVARPAFLPPPLADLNALAAWMCYSNFLPRLNIDRIEADYANIL